MSYNFRNYCIVVMGKTDGCKIEIAKISQNQPNYLPAKGITIATFISAFEPNELTEYFKSFNRNFLVFDLDDKNSGFNITNAMVSKDLFGFIDSQDTYELEEMSNKLIDEVNLTSGLKHKSGGTKQNSYIKSNKKDKPLPNIDKLSEKELTKMVDDIFDKGIDNLTEYDKKILDKIAKKDGK